MTYEEIRSLLDGRQWTPDALRALAQAFTWYSGDTRMAQLIAETVWIDEEDAGDNTPPVRLTDWSQTLGPRPRPVVDGLIDANACILLCGRPKSGKTFMALEIAECIATGEDLLGRWPVTRPGPVVYYSMEDSPYQFNDRWEKRGSLKRNPDVYIWRGRRDLKTAAGMAWLLDSVQFLEPRLLIIDTARQAFAINDWNNAAEVNAAFQPIVEAAHDLPHGASILIVAHTNKGIGLEAGARISGSNALQSIVDGYIVVDKSKRNADGDLEGEAECEGRIDMPARFNWKMEQDTLRVTALPEDEAAQRAVEKRALDKQEAAERLAQVIDVARMPLSATEIASALGMMERQAKERIRLACRLNVIEQVGYVDDDETKEPCYSRTLHEGAFDVRETR